jgi:DNA-binding NarL/FixJ family response regulator
MRVLLADNQSQARSALQILFKQEPDILVVGEASEAHTLLAQITTIKPDIVLLDWSLADLPTVGPLSTLRTVCPNLRIIALSGRPEACGEALAAGADAFISKTDPPEQLLTTLRAMNGNRNRRF